MNPGRRGDAAEWRIEMTLVVRVAFVTAALLALAAHPVPPTRRIALLRQ
jgi:hypothetical protein